MGMAFFQLAASYIGQRSSYINLQKDLHTNNTALLPLLNHCFSRVEEITCGQQKIVPSRVNLTLNTKSTKKLDGSLYLTLTTVAQETMTLFHSAIYQLPASYTTSFSFESGAAKKSSRSKDLHALQWAVDSGLP